MSYSAFLALYDFDDQIESCWKTILTATLIDQVINGVPVLTSRDAQIKTTPRIEIICATGAPFPQRTAQGQSGPVKKQVANAFNAQLGVKIVTTRPIGGGNAALHGPLCGLVRWQLSAGARVVNNTNLPMLQILDMQSNATQQTVYDPKSQDETTIIFDLAFAVNNAAWPAS